MNVEVSVDQGSRRSLFCCVTDAVKHAIFHFPDKGKCEMYGVYLSPWYLGLAAGLTNGCIETEKSVLILV